LLAHAAVIVPLTRLGLVLFKLDKQKQKKLKKMEVFKYGDDVMFKEGLLTSLLLGLV